MERSPSGALGVFSSPAGEAFELWDLRRRRFIAFLPRGVPDAPTRAIFSPDERLVVLALAGEVDPRRRPSIAVYESATGARHFAVETDRLRRRSTDRLVSEVGRHYFIRPRVVFAAASGEAVVGPFGGRGNCPFPFRIYDTATWVREGEVCLAGPNEALALADGGRRLAAGRAHRLQVFDLEAPDHTRHVHGVESVVGLLFSPDGEWLATESWEGFRLLRVATGAVHEGCDLRPGSSRSSLLERNLVATPEMVDFDLRLAMVFAADSSSLAVASEQLCWFDLRGATPRLEQRRLPFPAQSIRFSADGGELALVERFIDGYILEVIDLAGRTSHFSRPTAFLHPGAPEQAGERGWRVCGVACQRGLQRRCRPVDEVPLEAARCSLHCRIEERELPARRCVMPVSSTIMPALERARFHPSPIIVRRAEEHLRRLAPR